MDCIRAHEMILYRGLFHERNCRMKAAYRKGSGAPYIKEIARRPLGFTEIRVHVDACGICGSDILPRAADAPDLRFGHEIAGTIIEVAPDVTRVKVGDKIALDSATPCGHCENCRNGKQWICLTLRSFFKNNELGFSEEVIAPAISAIPYSGITPAVATLQEPLGVAIDMFRYADISVTSNVLVMGQGPIGLMAARLARRAGARRVFVSDFKWRTGREKVARAFGADDYIDPGETPLAKYNFGCKIDRLMVTSPPPTLLTAFDVAASGAIISFIGIGGGGAGKINFDADAFHFKKLQLRASFASPALYGPMAMQFLCEGVVDGEALVSHTFPLDSLAKAMEVAVKDPTAIKVVITGE
jgi:L-iditol 2-dehydrogenase